MTENYRYSVESRLRTRLRERLPEDVAVIRERYPEIFDELLYPTVCEPTEHDDDRAREKIGEAFDEARAYLAEETGEAVPEDVDRENAISQAEMKRRLGMDDSEGGELESAAEAALERLEVPGRKAAVKRTRREAIMYAWRRLRELESTRSRTLANDTFGRFFDDPDLGYSTSGRYPGYTMWDSCVRDALKQLPGVVPPGQRGERWEFDPDANPTE